MSWDQRQTKATLNSQVAQHQLCFVIGDDVCTPNDLAIVSLLCSEGSGSEPDLQWKAVVDALEWPAIRPLFIVRRGYQMPAAPDVLPAITGADIFNFASRYAQNWNQRDAIKAGYHQGAESLEAAGN